MPPPLPILALALALTLAGLPAHAQLSKPPDGRLPGVTLEVLKAEPGSIEESSDKCYRFVVHNGTSVWVDAYVRFTYRLEQQGGTSKWLGTKSAAPSPPTYNSGTNYLFGNLAPGERRVLPQFMLDSMPAENATPPFASLWFGKMTSDTALWNEPRKCAKWDHDITLPADHIRSEVAETQRWVERTSGERERRLLEVAEAVAKLTKLKTAPRAGPAASKEPGELLAQADEALERGDTEASHRLLRQLIAKHPEHPFSEYAADRLTAVRTGSPQEAAGRPAASADGVATDAKARAQRLASLRDSICLGERQSLQAKLGPADFESYVLATWKFGDRFVRKDADANLQTARADLDKWRAGLRDQALSGLHEHYRRNLEGANYFFCVQDTLHREGLLGFDAGGSLGAATTGNCDRQLAAHDAEVERVKRLPLPPGNAPIWQRAMWGVGEAVKIIDRHCPDRAQLRATYQSLYEDAEGKCAALLASRTCPGPNPFR